MMLTMPYGHQIFCCFTFLAVQEVWQVDSFSAIGSAPRPITLWVAKPRSSVGGRAVFLSSASAASSQALLDALESEQVNETVVSSYLKDLESFTVQPPPKAEDLDQDEKEEEEEDTTDFDSLFGSVLVRQDAKGQ